MLVYSVQFNLVRVNRSDFKVIDTDHISPQVLVLPLVCHGQLCDPWQKFSIVITVR